MIKVHKVLWYITTSKEDSDLAYMTYYEDNKAFEKRKSTGTNWAMGRNRPSLGDTVEAGTIENSPQTGFSIGESVSRWSTQNKVFRVLDPRGFTVEVPTGNISTLLFHTDVHKGIIQEPCVWGREGNNHILLPLGSEPYTQAMEDSKATEERVSYTSLKQGDVFNKTAGVSEKFLYCGKVKLTFLVELRQAERIKSYGRWSRGRWDRQPTTDEVLDIAFVKDTKWVHLIKNLDTSYGSMYYISTSGKAIVVGKQEVPQEEVNVWFPQRLHFRGFSEYFCSDIGQYNTTRVTDIEYKKVK